ncbi:hypothetical protein [Staphylococcus pseudintermedius]|uniref:hypothetical protein n=1 Tax=Staphylococcus pseudintermedius TaxID=283734 RepID=UPI0028FD0333|nr:hypothetical protein [Staphylococcus pseudintermedius]MDU0383872.1 hypothetical protein [Staphylococcus pseudintermedius]
MLELDYRINRGAWLVTTDYETSFTGNRIFISNDDLFEKIVEPFGTASIHRDMWKEFNDFLTQAGENSLDSDTRFVIASIQDKAKELQEKYEKIGAEFLE